MKKNKKIKMKKFREISNKKKKNMKIRNGK